MAAHRTIRHPSKLAKEREHLWMTEATPTDILTFWREAGRPRWYAKDDAFDDAIRSRFGALWEQAANGDLDDWQASDDGALALIIVLDQFPRNMHRGSPKMFSTDRKARDVALSALDKGADSRAEPVLKQFFYLPLMHSEELADQERCVTLFADEPDNLNYAKEHRDIIARFGRFPHRNPILGRAMTAAEQAYLDAEGFKG